MTNKIMLNGVVIFSVLGMVAAYAGYYVPKSYYVIDHDGHQSDLVYLRARRSADISKILLRNKRGGGSSYSSSSASASSSASSSAGSGPVYFGGDDFYPNHPNTAYSNVDSNAYNYPGASGNHPGAAQSFASASSSSNSGYGAGNGGGHPGAGYNQHSGGGPGPQLFSRFGESEGSNIQVSGSASGQKGAFSSVSSSSDGKKVHYSIQTGKQD